MARPYEYVYTVQYTVPNTVTISIFRVETSANIPVLFRVFRVFSGVCMGEDEPIRHQFHFCKHARERCGVGHTRQRHFRFRTRIYLCISPATLRWQRLSSIYRSPAHSVTKKHGTKHHYEQEHGTCHHPPAGRGQLPYLLHCLLLRVLLLPLLLPELVMHLPFLLFLLLLLLRRRRPRRAQSNRFAPNWEQPRALHDARLPVPLPPPSPSHTAHVRSLFPHPITIFYQ